MAILIDIEKIFASIEHIFMIEDWQKLEIDETYLNIIRTIYDKRIPYFILNGKKIHETMKPGIRQRYPLSILIKLKNLDDIK